MVDMNKICDVLLEILMWLVQIVSYEINKNQVYREINLSVRVSSHFWVIQSGIVHGQGVTTLGEHKFVVRFWAQTTRKQTFLHFTFY